MIKFKQLINIIIFSLIALTTSGCAGQIELDRVNFPVSLGIDLDEETNHIKVYSRIPIISGAVMGNPSQGPKMFRILEGEGETLGSALEDSVDKASQNISWKHVYSILISEKIAKRGLNSELDLLSRSQQMHINSYFIITDSDVRDLMESPVKIESSLPSPISAIRLIGNQSLQTKPITIRDFIMAYLCDSKDPILPKVSMEKPDGDEILVNYTGIGVFKKGRLVGFLDERESMGARLVYGVKTTEGLEIPYDHEKGDRKLYISSVTSNPDITSTINSQGLPTILVKLDISYSILENSIPKKIALNAADSIDQQVALYINTLVKNMLNKTQKEFGADIFGLGERVYKKYPKYWAKNKTKWCEIYPNIDINLKIKTTLKGTGETLDSIEFTY